MAGGHRRTKGKTPPEASITRARGWGQPWDGPWAWWTMFVLEGGGGRGGKAEISFREHGLDQKGTYIRLTARDVRG